MFSSRFRRWSLQPNRLTSALGERRRSGAPVLDLTVSDPTRAGLALDGGPVLEALRDGRSLVYEPVPAGLSHAREAVAGYYSGLGRTVSAGAIWLTASTSEAYAWVFKLLADPGDRILVPRPSYPLFEFLAEMESVRLGHYPLIYRDGWEADLDALREVVDPRTRAVVVVNPNNPTGSYLKEAELGDLRSICLERGIALICDEVFLDYPLEEDSRRAGSLAGEREVATFCLSGLSKVCALPQMKLGWLVCAGPRQAREEAAQRMEIIADTYLSVGSPVQHAAPRLLAMRHAVQRAIGVRTSANLRRLRGAAADGSACSVLRAEGGWSAILQVPGVRTGEEWALRFLERDGVLVQPGYLFDIPEEAYLVVSLLTPPDLFLDGIHRLLARL